MNNIALCVSNPSISSHWHEATQDLHVKIKCLTSEADLSEYLKTNDVVLLVVHGSFHKDIVNIIKKYLHVKILYLEDVPTYEKGKELLAYGLKGYGNSRLSPVHLRDAIESITNHNVWIYPEFIQAMIQDLSTSTKTKKTEKLIVLTPKQQEIALLVAEGHTNKEIATQCTISEATVKVHLRTIFEKMKVTDRLSLALALR